MMKVANALLFAALTANVAHAQTNAGEQKPEPDLPFTITRVASLEVPWRTQAA